MEKNINTPLDKGIRVHIQVKSVFIATICLMIALLWFGCFEFWDAYTNKHLCESQMHLQLGYSPPNAAADAVAKRDGAEVIDTVRGILANPTIWTELSGTGEVLFIHRGGVMTQSQLSLWTQEVGIFFNKTIVTMFSY